MRSEMLASARMESNSLGGAPLKTQSPPMGTTLMTTPAEAHLNASP